MRPPAKPNLAGQPAARPVVPPRPDLVARSDEAAGSPVLPPLRGPVCRPAVRRVRFPAVRFIPVRFVRASRSCAVPAVLEDPAAPPADLAHPRARPSDASDFAAARRTGHAARRSWPPACDQTAVARDRPPRCGPEEGRLRPVSRREQAFEPPPIDREITISEGITVKELSEKLDVKANLVIKKLVDRGSSPPSTRLSTRSSPTIWRAISALPPTSQLRRRDHAGDSAGRGRRGPRNAVRPWSPSWATSITARLRCSMPSARPTSPSRKPAASPSTSARITSRRTAARSSSSIRPATKRSPACAPAAPRSPISWCWWSRPTMASCRRRSKPSTTPAPPRCRSSSRSTRSTSRTRSPSASSSSFPIAACWPKTGAAIPSWCRFRREPRPNLDLLLEMILLVADMQDLKANPARPAMGTVLEAKLDRGRGPVATVLVRNGTLHVGDYFICGSVFGRVRAMFDDRGEPVREVLPVDAGRSARPRIAARSRRHLPGGHRYRQGQADRHLSREQGARSGDVEDQPHHARAAPRSDEGRRDQGTATSSSRPTWAARPKC